MTGEFLILLPSDTLESVRRLVMLLCCTPPFKKCTTKPISHVFIYEYVAKTKQHKQYIKVCAIFALEIGIVGFYVAILGTQSYEVLPTSWSA